MKILQTATIDMLLDRFGNRSLSPLPASSSTPLRGKKLEEKRFDDRYREAVGGLPWIANMSRLDISNAITEVARHPYDPTDRPLEAGQEILSHFEGGRKLRITFDRDAPDKVQAFTDSSPIPHSDDRQSTSLAHASWWSNRMVLSSPGMNFDLKYGSGIYFDG